MSEVNSKNKAKQLTLSIKQVYFDQILSGEKTIETREINPRNDLKYAQVDEDGMYLLDEKNGYVPVKYDRIKFLTGAYKGKRDYAIVEVKSAQIVLFVDEEKDEFIKLKDANGEEYCAAYIEFRLGKILETQIKPKDE